MQQLSFYHYTKAGFAKLIIENLAFKLSFGPLINDALDLDKDIIYNPEDKDGSELYNAICNDIELHKIRPRFALAHLNKKEDVLTSVKDQISTSLKPLKETIKKNTNCLFFYN